MVWLRTCVLWLSILSHMGSTIKRYWGVATPHFMFADPAGTASVGRTKGGHMWMFSMHSKEGDEIRCILMLVATFALTTFLAPTSYFRSLESFLRN